MKAVRYKNVRCTVDYYKTERGDAPVMDFLKKLPIKLRAKNMRELSLLEEFGTDLPAPYTKQLRGYKGLWELRVKLSSDITRIFYYFPTGTRILLLHGFTKKTNETPSIELETALRRMNDAIGRGL